MSPILGQEKGPEDQKDPGTGAHSSSILADFPPVVPGSPFPGRPMTSALLLWTNAMGKVEYLSKTPRGLSTILAIIKTYNGYNMYD